MALIGDLGGTYLRLARVLADGSITATAVLKVADHADLASAVTHYLRRAPGWAPRRAVFAVAGPVAPPTLRLTNAGWAFSRAQLARELGLTDCIIINDFVAQALALPQLAAPDLRVIGPGQPPRHAPKLVLGPGTGLGVAALIPDGYRWLPVATEAGHMDLAAANGTEDRLLAHVRRRYGHCSAERLLSGPGLLQLYRGLAEIDGRMPIHDSPTAVSAAAASGNDRLAGTALATFFAMLGGVAGNLALAYGAHGGVYLSGGILGQMAQALAASGFRQRFTAKGRFRGYLERIPTWLIVTEQPALCGLAALVKQQDTLAYVRAMGEAPPR